MHSSRVIHANGLLLKVYMYGNRCRIVRANGLFTQQLRSNAFWVYARQIQKGYMLDRRNQTYRSDYYTEAVILCKNVICMVAVSSILSYTYGARYVHGSSVYNV